MLRHRDPERESVLAQLFSDPAVRTGHFALREGGFLCRPPGKPEGRTIMRVMARSLRPEENANETPGHHWHRDRAIREGVARWPGGLRKVAMSVSRAPIMDPAQAIQHLAITRVGADTSASRGMGSRRGHRGHGFTQKDTSQNALSVRKKTAGPTWPSRFSQRSMPKPCAQCHTLFG